MINRPHHLAAALLLSLTLGLHWAVLQSVAWVAMLVERTHEASFSLAVETTFDGRHPCRICQVVEAGKSVEKDAHTFVKQAPFEISSPALPTFQVQPPRMAPFLVREAPGLESRSDRPPLPPPRLA